MENSTQPVEIAGPSESHRIAENAIYRDELCRVLNLQRETLFKVASVEELASHLGAEWFVVFELCEMVRTSLYLAVREVEEHTPS